MRLTVKINTCLHCRFSVTAPHLKSFQEHFVLDEDCVCLQDLAAVREGQDSLHVHVFRGQRGSDGALGRSRQQDAGAHGTHDEGLLAGTQEII